MFSVVGFGRQVPLASELPGFLLVDQPIGTAVQNSLKGWGSITGVIKGDTRSLDDGSYGSSQNRGTPQDTIYTTYYRDPQKGLPEILYIWAFNQTSSKQVKSFEIVTDTKIALPPCIPHSLCNIW